ncbi:class I SAM-dependent methyltransferase [Streptomyces sp. NBC_01262]|uniref:class I SAM-dependent methyltransferase n=1 Tax=Streptomyces sp. NBC_01262 TaxID=2903803 RepID=UPI002E34B4EC|nr:class I SAM-dependent methyltransferase [Streptomyces sp. NBC_01262]
MAAAPSYAFDNDDPEAADRHGYLAEIFDGLTAQRLSGLGDLTGRRCLEVGAGGGSIARWLARATGPAGRVLATDINTRYLGPGTDYEVLRHDLSTEPVPEGPWDVIHARMVLLHLPRRREILHRLAAALAPGGALVVEDFESTFRKSVLAAPAPAAAVLVDTYHRVLVEHVLPAHGNDPTWAGQVHAAMLAEGLTGLDTVVHARSWPGGTAGALLIGANIAQARADFLAAGMTDAELDELQRLAADPRLVVRSMLTYSTIGRR